MLPITVVMLAVPQARAAPILTFLEPWQLVGFEKIKVGNAEVRNAFGKSATADGEFKDINSGIMTGKSESQVVQKRYPQCQVR